MKPVDILMATRNGEAFIGEQIESLFQQTHKNWHLIARDDGSCDKTVEIMNLYKQNYPDKITIIDDNKKTLGASLNFGELLKYSEADYIMFCDQDDRWLPDKIELTFNKMSEMEKKYGKENALLVHTDLVVTDRNLKVHCNSFWKYRNLNPDNIALNCLLTENVVTGCTVMINRILKRIVNPIPPEAILHDWWVTLLASLFGKIGYITDPSVLYRQHEMNDIGARRRNLSEVLKYLLNSRRLLNRLRDYQFFKQQTIQQASSLYKKYLEMTKSPEFMYDSNVVALVQSYKNFNRLKFLNRKFYLLRNNLLNGYYMTRIVKLVLF